MSVYYYLKCDTHKVAVYIGDNKGNPYEREEWRQFELEHLVNLHGRSDDRCEVSVENEYELPDDYEIIGEE